MAEGSTGGLIEGFEGNRPNAEMEDLTVELFGNPKPEVVLAARLATMRALEEIGWKGPLPKIKIGSGAAHDHMGNKTAGLYGFEDKSIIIGQSKLQELMREELRGQIPDEAIAALVAAEEAVHYVQDMKGKLPHVPYVVGSDTPEEHYAIDTEREAAEISVRVANKLFPKVGFSRDGQGVPDPIKLETVDNGGKRQIVLKR